MGGWAVMTRPFERVRGPEGSVGGGEGVGAWIWYAFVAAGRA